MENGVVVMETDGKVGKITTAGPRSAIEIPAGAKHIDYADAVLAPGFIDIHIHGGAGHDVMEGSPSALAAIEKMAAARVMPAANETTDPGRSILRIYSPPN